MNAIVFGERRRRGQKVVAYSDAISTMLNLFLFLCFGSRRNECNSFWWREGGEVRSLLLTRKIFLSGILFICSHITFPMVYSFYFLCFGSGRNECNSLWEGEGERSKAYYLTRKVSLSGIFIDLLPHYISYGLFFLFSVF